MPQWRTLSFAEKALIGRGIQLLPTGIKGKRVDDIRQWKTITLLTPFLSGINTYEDLPLPISNIKSGGIFAVHLYYTQLLLLKTLWLPVCITKEAAIAGDEQERRKQKKQANHQLTYQQNGFCKGNFSKHVSHLDLSSFRLSVIKGVSQFPHPAFVDRP